MPWRGPLGTRIPTDLQTSGATAFVGGVGGESPSRPVGRYWSVDTAGSGVTVPLTGNVPVGALLIAVVGPFYTVPASLTMVDSKGHTWTKDDEAASGGNGIGSVWSTIITTPLVAGVDTITVGGTTFTKGIFLDARYILNPANPKVLVHSNAIGSGTAATSATVTPATALNFAIEYATTTGTNTASEAAPWAEEFDQTLLSAVSSFAVATRKYDDTTPVGASFTLTPTIPWGAGIVVYQQVAPSPIKQATLTSSGSGTTTMNATKISGGGGGGAPSIVQVIDAQQSAVAGTTIALTVPTGGIPIGDTVALGIGYSGALGLSVTSVTDTRGNTYTGRKNQDDGSATGAYSAAWDSTLTTALLAGDTITITISASVTHRMAIGVQLHNVTGVDSATPVGAAGTSTAPSAGGLATANANDVLFSVMCWNAGTAAFHTPGSGYTEQSEIETTGKGLAVDTQIVSATGTYTDAATLSSSVLWSAIQLAYTGGAGGTVKNATMTSAGTGTDTMVPNVLRNATLTSAGTSATTLTPNRWRNVTLTSAGTSTSTLTANRRRNATLTSTGSSTSTLTANRWRNASLASTGTSATTLTVNRLRNATLTSAGTSTTVMTAARFVAGSGTSIARLSPSQILSIQTFGYHVSTPHTSALNPGTTATIDLRFLGAMSNWIPSGNAFLVAKWGSEYTLYIDATGRINAAWTNAAGVSQFCGSSLATGLLPGEVKGIRALLNPGAGTCDFYVSDDFVTWTAFGTQVTGKTTTALQVPGTPASLRVGESDTGTAQWIGKVLRAQVLIGGVLVSDQDFSSQATGSTSLVAATGETWTLANSAVIARDWRAASEAIGDAATATLAVVSSGVSGVLAPATLTSSGTSTTAFVATRLRGATLTSAGTGTTTFAGTRWRTATLTSTGTSTTTVTPNRWRSCTLASAGTSATTFSANRWRNATLASAGTSTTSLAGNRWRTATLTSAGTSTTTLTPNRWRTRTLASAGTSTSSFAANRWRDVTLTSSGTSTSTFTTARIRAASLSSTGSSTSSFAPNRWRARTLSSTGTSTTTFTPSVVTGGDAGSATIVVVPSGAEAIADSGTATIVVASSGTEAVADAVTAAAVIIGSGAEAIADATTQIAVIAPTSVSAIVDAGTTTVTLTTSGADAIGDVATAALVLVASGQENVADAQTTTLVVAPTGKEALADASTAAGIIVSSGADAIADVGSTTAIIQVDTSTVADAGTATFTILVTEVDAVTDAGTAIVVIQSVQTESIADSGLVTAVLTTPAADAVADSGSSPAILVSSATQTIADQGTTSFQIAVGGSESVADATTVPVVLVSGAAPEKVADAGSATITISTSGSEALADRPATGSDIVVLAPSATQTTADAGLCTFAITGSGAEAVADAGSTQYAVLSTGTEAVADAATTPIVIIPGVDWVDRGTSTVAVVASGEDAVGDQGSISFTIAPSRTDAVGDAGTCTFTIAPSGVSVLVGVVVIQDAGTAVVSVTGGGYASNGFPTHYGRIGGLASGRPRVSSVSSGAKSGLQTDDAQIEGLSSNPDTSSLTTA